MTLAVLLVVAFVPTGSGDVSAESSGAFDRLGHGYLSLDTNLRSPSHISAWSIDEYLATHTYLPPLGHAFKAAETTYDVNALYLLAHAMHETGFGSSFISQRFHNLFGWNAADANPVGLATRFRSYAESIDFVAAQISTMYLSDGGRWWGGATTLRAMHGYASDPHWAESIVGIANSLVLSTLASRDVTFGVPTTDGPISTGQPVHVTVKATHGSPARRIARDLSVRAGCGGRGGLRQRTDAEARSSVPVRRRQERQWDGSTLVDAPNRPGRYRLELELRDSDGSPLTEHEVPAIPDLAVRVFGSDAVTYALSRSSNGVAVRVTNVGRRVIPAAGDFTSADDAVAGALPQVPASTGGAGDPLPPTSLSAWLIGAGGAATLIATVPLDRDLATGKTWATELPASLFNGPAPAVLLVRLQVGGAPGRLGGSPPGVFVVSALGNPATASETGPGAGATTGPDPSNDAQPAPVPSGPVGATTPPAPAADPAPAAISIMPVTPVDAVGLPLPPKKGSAVASSRSVESGKGKTAPARPNPRSVDVEYSESFDPATGVATVHLTNTGGVTITAGPPPADPGPGPGALPTSVQGSLVVTAVPAWGPAVDPIVLRLALPADLPPGRSIDVPIALAPSESGPSTYLVAARLDLATQGSAATSSANGPSGTGLTLAAPALPALFWLRNAGPAGTGGPNAGATGSVGAPTPGTTAAPTAAPTAQPSAAPRPIQTPRPDPDPGADARSHPRPPPTPTRPQRRPDPHADADSDPSADADSHADASADAHPDASANAGPGRDTRHVTPAGGHEAVHALRAAPDDREAPSASGFAQPVGRARDSRPDEAPATGSGATRHLRLHRPTGRRLREHRPLVRRLCRFDAAAQPHRPASPDPSGAGPAAPDADPLTR